MASTFIEQGRTGGDAVMGDQSWGGGGGGMTWRLLDYDRIARKAWAFHIYKPPKNLLKLTTNELPLEPVLLLLVRLGEEDEEEEEVDMRVARSSYRAWDSRGSWPKRPKAHGAAVEVGNREKEEVTEAILEREADIYDSAAVWVAYSLWCVSGWMEWGCRRNASLARDTPSPCAYICAPHP